MNIRERPPLRLHDEIITPSGVRYRWSPDEPSASNVPSRRRDSSTIPGGFESSDGNLQRQINIDYADLEPMSTHKRYGAGGEIAYEGRLERTPRVSGDQFSISPSSVGWQAHLDDDKSVKFLGRDIDLSHWQPASAQRRLANAASLTWHDFEIVPDATTRTPKIRTGWTGPWSTAPGRPTGEACYDAKGVSIGSLYYAWRRATTTSIPSPFTNWSWEAFVSDDDLGTTSDTTGNLAAAGPSSGTLNASADRKFAFVRLFFANVAGGTDGTEYAIDWAPIVYGDHDLTPRGADPDAGFYDADLIGYALDQWCPLISYTHESLTADSFVIPQFAFLEPTTVAEIIRQATRFSVRPWAVWEDRTFWLYSWGMKGRNWRARIGPSGLEETGPQVDRIWNSIIVAYQDVDGSTRTVGPVGSGADTEDDALSDDDAENPSNKLGIIRRDMLTMGVGTAASATEVGRRFLEESKRLDTSGRAVFNGYVEDDRGVVHPYWKVRAGDTVTFVDAADTSARRIVRADNDHDARTSSVDLDSPPEGLQALLERLSVVLIPLGL